MSWRAVEMVVDVLLPQWGMGMSEGTIVAWLKNVGDEITEGEPLVEVETAKATAAVDAPASGVLIQILAEVGRDVPVFSVLGLIDDGT